ncbi:hypothetical protein L1987_37877 [Smallanthus sonchifolius]|uniref:Uncharacterized protein n=1 Tax=Smallanthus sonchifolius TaxID=185202 RepID=A0ACB9HIT2_9ASTR|nr:hypothetical protein L1987_37877 [Smallanthus sonchifolius]
MGAVGSQQPPSSNNSSVTANPNRGIAFLTGGGSYSAGTDMPNDDSMSATAWIDSIIKDLIHSSTDVSIPHLIHNVREIIHLCNTNLAVLLEYRLRSLTDPAPSILDQQSIHDPTDSFNSRVPVRGKEAQTTSSTVWQQPRNNSGIEGVTPRPMVESSRRTS